MVVGALPQWINRQGLPRPHLEAAEPETSLARSGHSVERHRRVVVTRRVVAVTLGHRRTSAAKRRQCRSGPKAREMTFGVKNDGGLTVSEMMEGDRSATAQARVSGTALWHPRLRN
ncbi:MAG: hypothetical protein LQ342_007586 [Letrouitia transgressa]|nr:MAG: hypothetical protein LQ342_007586 [Letrouitia transgressa]